MAVPRGKRDRAEDSGRTTTTPGRSGSAHDGTPHGRSLRTARASRPVLTVDPLSWPGYDDQLAAARQRTGQPEAVTCEVEVVGGVEVMAIRWDFGFLGGSVGSVTGATVADGFERATRGRLPVILVTATGGSRMQEGMASLVQMPAVVVAQRAHARAGLLQVAVLGHPTTGGVFASFGNLAHVTLVVDGATIGFAGPRVAEAMAGRPLPAGSHTATGALAAGLADAAVGADGVDDALSRILAWTRPNDRAPVAVSASAPGGASEDPWDAVQRSRASDRARAEAF
ncbi:MAG: carboxyl transferase domain-containing protein, partial [Nitriliruptorales bacterium]|nr:carboxyl transferase domain-containing protein [Nitriliruptorales bacterium]